MDSITDRLIAIYNTAPSAKARGKVLHAWRKRAGWTQQAAADAVGLSKVMVCLCESGGRNMALPHLRVLLEQYLEETAVQLAVQRIDRKSTRLNSSH